MRIFETGATRDSNEHKLAIHRFLSPKVQVRYCEYLQKHRVQADGELRDPDNWKKGMDQAVYFESLTRHFFDAWVEFERTGVVDLDVMCAIRFNVDGFMFEGLRKDRATAKNQEKGVATMTEWFAPKERIDAVRKEMLGQCEAVERKFGKSAVSSPEYQAAQQAENERIRSLVDAFNEGLRGNLSTDPAEPLVVYPPVDPPAEETRTITDEGLIDYLHTHGRLPETTTEYFENVCPCGAKEGEEHKKWCGYSDAE